MRGNKAYMPSSRDGSSRASNRTANQVFLETSSDGSHFEIDVDSYGMPPDLSSDVAGVLAEKMSSRGPWRTAATCANGAWIIKRLARMLQQNGLVLERLTDFTPGLYSAFELTTSPSSIASLRALLRQRQGYSREMQDILDRRTRVRRPPQEDIGHEEATRLRAALDAVLLQARRRMHPYSDLFEPHSEDHHTADGSEQAKRKYLRGLIDNHGVRERCHNDYRLYVAACRSVQQQPASPQKLQELVVLRKWECDALILRIILEYGWNLTTVQEMEVPHEQRNPLKTREGTYSVKLVKRRRFANAVEHRTLPIIDRERSSDLITLAIRLTHFSRLGAPDRSTASRLFLHGALLDVRSITAPEHFGTQSLARRLSLPSSAVSPKRLRKYVNTLDRRSPNQNTRATHDRDYVATSLPAKRAALDVIEAGFSDALSKANDFYKTMLEPAELTVETVGAGCMDATHGPFTRAGTACNASFLWCFACPNARVAPRHLPVVTLVWDSLNARQSIPDYFMREDESAALASIENLKSMHLTAAQWRQAEMARSRRDAELVELLLTGVLDG